MSKRKDYGARVRIWDNGGKTVDRYTILPPAAVRGFRDRGLWEGIGADEQPFHPQGFGQHIIAEPGRHLGKRIHWNELPADVQRFARQEFPGFVPEAQ